jgi:hypothetical protein
LRFLQYHSGELRYNDGDIRNFKIREKEKQIRDALYGAYTATTLWVAWSATEFKFDSIAWIFNILYGEQILQPEASSIDI